MTSDTERGVTPRTDIEKRLERALGELPTVLHNRLSDGSRGPLAATLVAVLADNGLRLISEAEAPVAEEQGDFGTIAAIYDRLSVQDR